MIFFLDLRVKGFSRDGIFRSDSYRSYYSLSNIVEKSKNHEKPTWFLRFGILSSYILATETTYFGKKFNKNWSDLYVDEDFVFMAQTFAKNVGICSNNGFGLSDVNLFLIAINVCKNVTNLTSN